MKHAWMGLVAVAVLAWGPAQASPVVGFSGNFAPANWTATVGTNGAAPTMDASFLSITSPQPDDLDDSETRITIVVANRSTISFTWDYLTSDVDADPFYDPFGVISQNGYTQLTDDLGAVQQDGTATFVVDVGETFGFYAQALQGDFGTATTRIGNFRVEAIQDVPEPASLLLMAAAVAALTATRRRRVGHA